MMIASDDYIGVIGCGWWGKNIIRTLNKDFNCKNIVCFDPSREALNSIKNDFQLLITENINDLLDNNKIKAVCIVSPPQTHYSLAKQMLEKGKNVFIEKPPTLNLDELEELNNLAKNNDLVYMLDCLYLFSEPIVKLKELIKDFEKQKLKFVHFHRIGDELRREKAGISRIRNSMYKNDVDIIDDLFFHDAGILFHLFDLDFEIESVQKLFLYHKSIADTIFINLKGSFPVKIDLSWTLGPKKRGVDIFYDDKIIVYDAFNDSNEINIFSANTTENKKIKYNNNQALKDMLKYFIEIVYSKHNNNYIGNFDLMKKIMKLKLLV